jgi:hypothetical protein
MSQIEGRTGRVAGVLECELRKLKAPNRMSELEFHIDIRLPLAYDASCQSKDAVPKASRFNQPGGGRPLGAGSAEWPRIGSPRPSTSSPLEAYAAGAEAPGGRARAYQRGLPYPIIGSLTGTRLEGQDGHPITPHPPGELARTG